MIQPARHMRRKAPRKTRGFSWARLPDAGRELVTWRLHRGDATGRLYSEMRTFPASHQRPAIARALRAARHQLRDRVDEISLRQLGVEA